MKLLATYILFVLIGDAGAYAIGRSMEYWLSQSLSLAVFLTCFFLVFGLAWVLAVRMTKPRTK
jgi:hypothetical protein